MPAVLREASSPAWSRRPGQCVTPKISSRGWSAFRLLGRRTRSSGVLSALVPAIFSKSRLPRLELSARKRTVPITATIPDATRTYVFPNESKVADNGGIIYNTTDLTYVNSLGGAFTDLDFS